MSRWSRRSIRKSVVRRRCRVGRSGVGGLFVGSSGRACRRGGWRSCRETSNLESEKINTFLQKKNLHNPAEAIARRRRSDSKVVSKLSVKKMGDISEKGFLTVTKAF